MLHTCSTTWCVWAVAAAAVGMSAGARGSYDDDHTNERVWLFVDPGVVAASSRGAGGDAWEVVVPPVKKEPSNPVMSETEIWEVRWDNT